MDYKKNVVDPCMFFKQEGKSFCLLCLYVDDSIITGDENMMNKTIEGLNEVFKIKVQKDINDFLGCEIKEVKGGFQLNQTYFI